MKCSKPVAPGKVSSGISGNLSSRNAGKLSPEYADSIRFIIMWRTPEFLLGLYHSLSDDAHKMNDQVQAQSLVDAGKFSIETKNWSRLGEITRSLLNLLPKSAQQEMTGKIGF